MNVTLSEFYNNLGIKRDPFAYFTTENERNFFHKIFVEPSEYEAIIDNFNNNTSIIIIGDRGTGKTAIIEELIRNSNNDDNCLTTIITDFSALDLNYNNTSFYHFLISNVCSELFRKIAKQKRSLGALSRHDKLMLCWFYLNFTSPASKAEISKTIRNFQVPKWQRLLHKLLVFSRFSANYAAKVGSNIFDEYFIKHFRLSRLLDGISNANDLLPELPLQHEENFFDHRLSFSLFENLNEIIKNLGFTKNVIFVDRIDEDQRFENDAEAISEFLVKILTDGNFLLAESSQLVLTTWQTPYNFISSRARIQKHYCPKLEWNTNDLEKALNKRLEYFSEGGVNNYKSLFESSVAEEDFEKIINLANFNPRDLWHIFKEILKSQYSIGPSANKISKNAVESALISYVVGFEYYEYYPRKSNARANSMDVYAYIKHLLKLSDSKFSKNQFNEKADTGGSTANYLVGMERIGLIKKLPQEMGVVYYEIKDPKVRFALEKGLTIDRS